TSCHCPSRLTVAVGVTIDRSASAARSDRYPCQKLIETLSVMIVTMMTASTTWPSAADTALATRRIATSGFVKRRSSCANAANRRVTTGSFGPNSPSLRTASADVSPTKDRFDVGRSDVLLSAASVEERVAVG